MTYRYFIIIIIRDIWIVRTKVSREEDRTQVLTTVGR